MTTTTTRTVTTSDGVPLAVFETGDPTRPTVVAVHGYPDDHHVWDGVVAELADPSRPGGGFHVVTYDVRGTGASGAPSKRSGYRIPRLAADLAAVIDATAPGERVHLLAHDWGSIQSWGAVTDPEIAARLATFTSISGPSLDMSARWLRGIRRHPGGALRQLGASWYIAMFQLPVLPGVAVRAGVVDDGVAKSAAMGDPVRPGTRRPARRDATNGIELYRANFAGAMLRPRPGRTDVPVQVLAPRLDAHVTVDLQCEAPAPYCRELTTTVIEGNHWVVEHDPELIAAHVTAFAEAHTVPLDA